MKKILSLLFICSVTLGFSEEKYKEYFPEFSWDRVPVYLHFSKVRTDFTPEELAFIARFPFITLEKRQGYTKHGSTEAGTLAAARAITEVNPKAKVLFYFNACLDYGHMYKYGYILADLTNAHWAIKDVKGGYAVARNMPNFRMYDFSQKEVRDWWVAKVVEYTSYDEIAGVFIDALPKYVSSPESKKESWGEKKYKEICDGLHLMLDSLKNIYAGDKLMIANYLRGNTKVMPDMGEHFLNYTDGGMIEHFNFMLGDDKEYLANDIALLQKAAQKGKIAIAKGWAITDSKRKKEFEALSLGEKEEKARRNITFPLACFLIGAGEYSYFCYSWAYRHDEGGMIDYAEYDKPLGEPLGDAVKKGWEYTRKFKHADVWVNVDTKEAKINWK